MKIGEIVMVKARIVPINEIINKAISNIETRIDNTPKTSIEINIGKITGISFFSSIGPKFYIKTETSRTE